MSFKTDRLAALIPDAYAAREGASLLHQVLDTVGFELMGADAAVKALLKSHWVNYAKGDALDGLAATFGVERRRLSDGSLEPDEVFQARLKAVVPYFTGGGTLKAIAGAVRVAKGLPFDLEQFRTELEGATGDPTGQIAALVQQLRDLVQIEEFSPKGESVVSGPVTRAGEQSEVTVEVGFTSVMETYPRIEWTFAPTSGWFVWLQQLDDGHGVQSIEPLQVPAGKSLVLTAGPNGALSASIDTLDVTSKFRDLDGTSAPVMPKLPREGAKWRFVVRGGQFDKSSYDGPAGMDNPDFTVTLSWVRRLPLTFDVIVPYFTPESIKKAVEDLAKGSASKANVFFWEGLPRNVFQTVVDQTRAAGVSGVVQFSLRFQEDHAVQEALHGTVQHARTERQDASEVLSLGSVNTASENHAMTESQFAVGGVFNVSKFDGSTGFNSPSQE